MALFRPIVNGGGTASLKAEIRKAALGKAEIRKAES
jgi:hypothetical protein